MARITSSYTTKRPLLSIMITTIVAVVELSLKTWVIAGHIPGYYLRPKKTEDRAEGLKPNLNSSLEEVGLEQWVMAEPVGHLEKPVALESEDWFTAPAGSGRW